MWQRGGFSAIFPLFATLGIILLLVNCNNAQTVDRFKLNGHSRPVHYDLEMRIDVDEQLFSGLVMITIEVVEPTRVIELYYKDMTISSVKLLLNGIEMTIESQTYSEETEILRLEYPDTLEGPYKLLLEFNSKIRTDLKGLYMSTYFDELGNKRHIATTFMAPTYARMAFPCYDEPEYKANYTIHVSHADKYFALSNMPEDRRTDLGDGWRTTHFQESKPTSTYIVAFIVCDFLKIEKTTWPLSIYAQPVALKDTQYALEHFDLVRGALEVYLGRKFQYPKLDMIAIDDFLMGAMENWGLITYLSSRIVISDETDIKTKIAGSKTLSHELAHQWFGNEVTHYYWNVVWLKEGLATLFEDILTNKAHPEWLMYDQFVINTMQVAMVQDSVPNARHMMKTYSTPAEIRAVYDYVTYKKAGSVMMMMMNVLTEPVFQKAMDFYIEDNSFSTATHQSLTSAWQKAIDQSDKKLPDIATVFDHWINVPGYPVIFVQRNYEDSSVKISQQRFIASQSTHGADTYLYHIPLNYATSDFIDTEPTYWLTEREATFQLTSPVDRNQWVVFNKLATGYYRVNYDAENWKLIKDQLHSITTAIPRSNRAQLIDDAMNLARFGQMEYSLALELVSYLAKEKDAIPLTSAFTNLRDLERIGRGSDLYLETFYIDLVDDLYESNSLANGLTGRDIDKLRRVEVVNFACKYGHPDCAKTAFEMLTKELNQELPADFRSAIFCGAQHYLRAITNGDLAAAALLDRVIKRSPNEAGRRKNDKEINEIYNALSCVQNNFLLNVLDYTINPPDMIYFDKGDPNKIFAGVAAANLTGTTHALKFLKDNLDEVQLKYESMVKVIEALAPNVVTQELKDLFFEILDELAKDAEAPVQQAIDAAKIVAEENVNWKTARSEDVRKFFRGSAVSLLLNPLVGLIVVFVALVRNL